MTFIPTLVVVSSTADKTAGGNVVVAEFNDTHTRTTLFPDGHAEAEFRNLETGEIEILQLSRGNKHVRDVRETERELGYPSAGRILMKR